MSQGLEDILQSSGEYSPGLLHGFQGLHTKEWLWLVRKGTDHFLRHRDHSPEASLPRIYPQPADTVGTARGAHDAFGSPTNIVSFLYTQMNKRWL